MKSRMLRRGSESIYVSFVLRLTGFFTIGVLIYDGDWILVQCIGRACFFFRKERGRKGRRELGEIVELVRLGFKFIFCFVLESLEQGWGWKEVGLRFEGRGGRGSKESRIQGRSEFRFGLVLNRRKDFRQGLEGRGKDESL